MAPSRRDRPRFAIGRVATPDQDRPRKATTPDGVIALVEVITVATGGVGEGSGRGAPGSPRACRPGYVRSRRRVRRRRGGRHRALSPPIRGATSRPVPVSWTPRKRPSPTRPDTPTTLETPNARSRRGPSSPTTGRSPSYTSRPVPSRLSRHATRTSRRSRPAAGSSCCRRRLRRPRTARAGTTGSASPGGGALGRRPCIACWRVLLPVSAAPWRDRGRPPDPAVHATGHSRTPPPAAAWATTVDPGAAVGGVLPPTFACGRGGGAAGFDARFSSRGAGYAYRSPTSGRRRPARRTTRWPGHGRWTRRLAVRRRATGEHDFARTAGREWPHHPRAADWTGTGTRPGCCRHRPRDAFFHSMSHPCRRAARGRRRSPPARGRGSAGRPERARCGHRRPAHGLTLVRLPTPGPRPGPRRGDLRRGAAVRDLTGPGRTPEGTGCYSARPARVAAAVRISRCADRGGGAPRGIGRGRPRGSRPRCRRCPDTGWPATAGLCDGPGVPSTRGGRPGQCAAVRYTPPCPGRRTLYFGPPTVSRSPVTVAGAAAYDDRRWPDLPCVRHGALPGAIAALNGRWSTAATGRAVPAALPVTPTPVALALAAGRAQPRAVLPAAAIPHDGGGFPPGRRHRRGPCTCRGRADRCCDRAAPGRGRPAVAPGPPSAAGGFPCARGVAPPGVAPAGVPRRVLPFAPGPRPPAPGLRVSAAGCRLCSGSSEGTRELARRGRNVRTAFGQRRSTASAPVTSARGSGRRSALTGHDGDRRQRHRAAVATVQIDGHRPSSAPRPRPCRSRSGSIGCTSGAGAVYGRARAPQRRSPRPVAGLSGGRPCPTISSRCQAQVVATSRGSGQ